MADNDQAVKTASSRPGLLDRFFEITPRGSTIRQEIRGGIVAFVAMGAVVLAITGAEALYADMGHFGHRPIAVAWFTVALPGLLLNYFGQGALLLQELVGAGERPGAEEAP